MKTYAHHNRDGSITSLISLNLPESAGLLLTPKAGVYVTEIEGIKLKGELPEFGELREIMRTRKISNSAHVSVLTKK
jgi:hypothetical protein